MKKEDLSYIVDSAPTWVQNLANLYPPSFAMRCETEGVDSITQLRLVKIETVSN